MRAASNSSIVASPATGVEVSFWVGVSWLTDCVIFSMGFTWVSVCTSWPFATSSAGCVDCFSGRGPIFCCRAATSSGVGVTRVVGAASGLNTISSPCFNWIVFGLGSCKGVDTSGIGCGAATSTGFSGVGCTSVGACSPSCCSATSYTSFICWSSATFLVSFMACAAFIPASTSANLASRVCFRV